MLGPRFDTIGPVEQNENDLLEAGLGLTQASIVYAINNCIVIFLMIIIIMSKTRTHPGK